MSEAAEAAVPADEVQTETPTPPASEAEAPVVPENRESIKTKAKESAERLGRALFRRKLTEKDDQLLTGSQRAVKTFLRLQEETQAQEGEPTSYINPDKPKGIELNGKPIIVEKDGRQLTLLSITGQVNKDGVAMALCTYRQGQGSPSTPELIPWNDIVNAQIISEQQEFSQMFQGDEQAVFNY